MRLKGTLKSSKLNKKLYSDLKKLEGKVKAGYPKENSKSTELDSNGYSAIHKAYEINYANQNFIPYLQIAYQNNIIKYKRKFKAIAKSSARSQDKKLDKLGLEMVNDIKSTIKEIQHSPASNSKGCIFGAVTFSRVKK